VKEHVFWICHDSTQDLVDCFPDVEMMEILIEMQMFTFLVWSAHIVQIFASSKDEKPKSG
jgi:hypothetical protein